MREPTRTEDATNLSLIGGAALVAAFLTLGLVAAPFLLRQKATVEVHDVRPVIHVTPAPVVTVAPVVVEHVVVEAFEGDDRLYGTVIDRRGSAHTGYIRWDRNEGSWSDLLDATKEADRRRRVSSGIRFGHIDQIEVTSRESARFTLKSGESFELGSNATDLGSGLRAVIVEGPGIETVTFDWRDLDVIEFKPAPDGTAASEQRIHGTLTTRAGLSFTGHIAWDRDEIYSTDILDGEDDFTDREIPFGSIEIIERHNRNAARVVLLNGEETILRGTNDVDGSNRGITVSDVGLGQIDVSWDDFESVRFHPAEVPVTYGQFDGGARIRGTVVTTDGTQLSGAIAWDRDESYTWEMLDGDYRGIDFSVEFGKISRIERTGWGVEVELKDGRTFELDGSNDVDDGNRGIAVETDEGTTLVRWDDFSELRLEG